MLLRYILPDGNEKEFKIEQTKITIGRGLDVDLALKDRIASRLHCCIEYMDNGSWYIRDLHSRNGTYVNGEQVQHQQLKMGDRIRVGDTSLVFESASQKGAATVIRELKNEMDGGKGFKTMLIEIVGGDNKTRKSGTDKINTSSSGG